MADVTTPDEVVEAPDEKPLKKGGVLPALIWGTMGLVLGAGGFAIPFIFPGVFGRADAEQPEVVPAVAPLAPEKVAFVPFGDVTVNLNSDRFNRYLRIDMTLQISEDELENVTDLVEKKKSVMKSWLLSYLSEKNLEEIRGAAGQNRLRREILDQFNSTLFDDGYDRVYDVLFEEFNVQ